jgi:hypothetical protein
MMRSYRQQQHLMKVAMRLGLSRLSPDQEEEALKKLREEDEEEEEEARLRDSRNR